MNSKTNHRFGVYLPLMILLCTVACTLRTVAALLGVDSYGYFTQVTLNSVSVWILVGAIVVMLTYPIAYAKRPYLLVRHTTPLTFIPSLLCALVLIFFVGEMGFKLLATPFPIDRILHLAMLVLGVVSAIFFFALTLVESGVSDKKANYGMSLVLLLGIYAASLYLSTAIPRNSHVEISEEMTLIAISLFFLYEIRISLDKPKQNLYVTFGFIAAMLCAYTAIPSLIFYIANGRLLFSSISVFLLTLALLIFIIARLYLFNITPEDKATPLVHSLAEQARVRADAVRELEALYAPTPETTAEAETDENQSEEPTADAEAEAGEGEIAEAQEEAVEGELVESQNEVAESTPDTPITEAESESGQHSPTATESIAKENAVAAPEAASEPISVEGSTEETNPPLADEADSVTETAELPDTDITDGTKEAVTEEAPLLSEAVLEDSTENAKTEKGENNEEDSGH